MKQSILLSLATLALVGSLAGCGGDDKPKKSNTATETTVVKQDPIDRSSLDGKSPMDLMPHEVGDQWVYENPAGDEVVFKVAESTKKGDVVDFRIDVLVEGEVRDSTNWRISPEGFFQTAAKKGMKFEPALPIATFPIEYGKEVSYDGVGPYPGTADKSGKQAVLSRVRDVELIDTPMGQMSAMAIETVTRYNTNNSKGEAIGVQITARIWMAPGYGIVLYKDGARTLDGQTGSSSLKLKSFSGKSKSTQ